MNECKNELDVLKDGERTWRLVEDMSGFWKIEALIPEVGWLRLPTKDLRILDPGHGGCRPDEVPYERFVGKVKRSEGVDFADDPVHELLVIERTA